MTGAELKAIRKALGLSTVGFGRALGYQGNDQTTNTVVRRYENERRDIPPWISRLAEMFRRHGVPAEWLD